VPYTDVANQEGDKGRKSVYATCSKDSIGDEDGNPPVFAPPALRVPGAGKDGKALIISQTPNILLYLGPKLNLIPDEEVVGEGGLFWVNSIALTALDWCNEAHDTHHPVALVEYYDAQKTEALRKAKDFRATRVPKYLGYFERVLKGNEKLGSGKHLVGDKLTYADLVLWQVVDG
jgi:glutathione S-transferase